MRQAVPIRALGPVAERARPRHNLHELAWRPWDPNEPATLDALMSDYVAHLQHHLAQVWAAVDV